MDKYLFIFIIWIYSTLCLFLVGIGGSFYIQSIPIKNNDESLFYQIYYFIPLCLFTTYFNKKIYIQN